MPGQTPKDEVTAAFGVATMAALKTLIICLQDNGALEPNQFPEALRGLMEKSKDDMDDLSLAMLHELRMSVLS
jgi:hypothetical protein